MVQQRDGRNRRTKAGAQQRRGGAVVWAVAGGIADWLGSHGQQSVVRGVAAETRTRSVDRRRSTDPGQVCAQTEDGQAGRGAHSETAVGGAVSATMEAEPRAAGHTAVAHPSAQAGGDPDASEERTAAPGDESWDAEEASAVERSGTARVTRAGHAGLGGVPTPRPVGDTGVSGS